MPELGSPSVDPLGLGRALETFMAGAGVPPVDLIARMANAYFQDVPGSVVEAPSATPAELALPGAAAGTAPAGPALPVPSRMFTLGRPPVDAAPDAPRWQPPNPTSATGATSTVTPLALGGATAPGPVATGSAPPAGAPEPAYRPPGLTSPGNASVPDVSFLEAITVAAASRATPFRTDVLTLPPESIAYSPARIPELPREPRAFDPYAIRRDFPILGQQVNGRPLVWLDNGATTQKPRAVIDRLVRFYEHENSNVHRGAHTLAARATDAYEGARETVARFLNAASPREIVFVRGTTEGINLVAQSWGRANIGQGDEIVVSHLEHHANIVPWQQLAAEKGARIRVAPVDDTGQVILEEYLRLLNPRTRLVAFTAVSNALGTVTPAQAMTAAAHAVGAHVLIDGAQAVAHLPVDVQSLGADWFVFSGHKLFAPTGVGVVYGRQAVLDAMPPWQGGGNMIADVTFERTVFQPAPQRFEAGTGTIADAVGLGAAIDYVTSIGLPAIAAYEHDLLAYATDGLLRVPGLRLYGTAPGKAGVLSFTLAGRDVVSVGQALDREGIAVRAGHHCAQPILRRFGVEGTVRASLAPYVTCEDIDALVAALHRIAAGS